MNKLKFKNPIFEIMAICLLEAALVFIAYFIPLIGIAALFVIPAPMLYLVVNRNVKFAIVPLLVVTLVSFCCTQNATVTAFFLLFTLAPPFVGANCLHKNKSFAKSLIYTIGTLLLVFVLLALWIIYAMKIDLTDLSGNYFKFLKQNVEEVILQLKVLYESSEIGSIPPEEFAGTLAETVKQFFYKYFPAMLVCFSAVCAYIWLAVSGSILKFLGHKSTFVPFYNLCAPKSMIFAMVLLFLFTLSESKDVVSVTLINMYSVVLFGFFICGFSFVDYKLKEKIPPGILRFLFYVFTIVFLSFGSFFLYQVLILIGITDCLWKIRLRNDDEKYL